MNHGGLSKERDLFRRALCEGLSRRYEQELEACPEPVPCSETHTERMRAIAEAHLRTERQRRLRRRLTVLLVAAALLAMTACTVYVCRDKIHKLMIEQDGPGLYLSYPSSRPIPDMTISEYYTPSYVPEGYELVDQRQCAVVNHAVWKNAEGSTLVWEQMFCYGSNYTLDAETGESEILKPLGDDTEIYYRVSKAHTYIWNDGTYSFCLTSTAPLADGELEKILEGIRNETDAES